MLDHDNLYMLTNVVEKCVFNNLDKLWNHKDILSYSVLGYTKEE